MSTSLTFLESIACLTSTLVIIIALVKYFLNRNKTAAFNPLKTRFPAFCLGLAWSLAMLIASFEITTIPANLEQQYLEAVPDILDLEVVNKRTKADIPKQVKRIPLVIDTIVFVEVDNTDTLTLVKPTVDIDSTAIVDTTMTTMVPTPPSPPTLPLPKPKDPLDDDKEYKIVEEMPRFPGCESVDMDTKAKESCANSKLLQYVHSKIKYPAIARDNNVSGTVIARFVVKKDGSISNISILRDIGAGCGNEVEKVLRSMNSMESPWRAGRQQGRPVNVLFTLPVKFSLQ